MTHCATGFGFCCLFFTGGRPTRNHRIASFCRGFYALSGVEFLGEMRGFLNARALLPLIPPTPFSHKGRRGSLGVLKPKTREGIHGLPRLGARAARPQRCVHRLGVGAARPPFTGWECGVSPAKMRSSAGSGCVAPAVHRLGVRAARPHRCTPGLGVGAARPQRRIPGLGVGAARPQRRIPGLGVGASRPPFTGWEWGRLARKDAFIGWECGRRARRSSAGSAASRPQRCVHRLGVGRRARKDAFLGRECGRRARIGVKHCVDHAPPNTRRNHDCCPTTCSCAGTSVRQESKAF